ncbi:hypothetical protein HAX54_027940, partial [Datura stramonium]|nr:hypothetical protein [Datura stramonium]
MPWVDLGSLRVPYPVSMIRVYAWIVTMLANTIPPRDTIKAPKKKADETNEEGLWDGVDQMIDIPIDEVT